jgi:hypothetical protein
MLTENDIRSLAAATRLEIPAAERPRWVATLTEAMAAMGMHLLEQYEAEGDANV